MWGRKWQGIQTSRSGLAQSRRSSRRTAAAANTSGQSWPPPPYGYTQGSSGTHRIFVTRIGPLGFGLFMLVVGLFAAVLLLLLIGTALIWLPFVAALVIVSAVVGVLRRL